MIHRLAIAFLCNVTVILLLGPPAPVFAQELPGKVVDENGLVVAGAKVSLSGGSLTAPLLAVSDDAGRFVLSSVPPGTYELKAEKPGYYATVSHALEIKGSNASLEVVLNHQQEFEEKVNVVYSAPVVDRQEASAATALTAEETIDLSFVATHDFRNSLPLIPGVIKDNKGSIHMSGGRENQVLYSLDGFNITSPVSGILEEQIPVDAIRTLQVETSRYSAEFGKGSAGVMALESSRGDDRFRVSSTNFLPSWALNSGLVLSNWNPRATVSGPILKGRAWYYDALGLQYGLNMIKELPRGANAGNNWLGSNLMRIQVNLTGRNILTGGFLFNFRRSRRFGISPLDPVETSRNLDDRLYFFNLKDQAYFSGGWVLETGVAVNQINTRADPLGNAPYVISPQGRSGNYYMQSSGKVGRTQFLASMMSPIWNWHGRNSFKFGIDADRINYQQLSNRRAFEIRSSAGSLSRLVDFQGRPRFGRDSTEFSSFVQDSWTLNDQMFVAAGVRFDWDQILRRPLWSPRLAFTWGPARLPESKFSAGIGVFYDATNLGLLTRGMDQERLDTFYDETGVPLPGGPITSRFVANERDLKAPFFLNWSLGWQQKLGRGFYLETNFIRKNGRHGWVCDLTDPSDLSPAHYVYRLGSTRRDSYSYAEAQFSRTFKGKYPWLLSYARSSAHATAVIDFSQDNATFSRQAGGPLDWDSPNRLISWSVLPLPHFDKYSMAYSAEWHSGMPWSDVNQFQELVGNPNLLRFPDYFCLNLHVERRIHLWHSEWALRVGFNNLTDHLNPTTVNNNIDAVDFGRFSGSQRRVFTGRIRFLGKT
jgi:hypothetical protein